MILPDSYKVRNTRTGFIMVGGVRGVYNKAQYLDERRRMMQDWADFIDQLRHDKS